MGGNGPARTPPQSHTTAHPGCPLPLLLCHPAVASPRLPCPASSLPLPPTHPPPVQIMETLLRIFISTRGTGVHEEAMLAVGTLTIALGDHFRK